MLVTRKNINGLPKGRRVGSWGGPAPMERKGLEVVASRPGCWGLYTKSDIGIGEYVVLGQNGVDI